VGLWQDLAGRLGNVTHSPSLLVPLEHLIRGESMVSIEWHFYLAPGWPPEKPYLRVDHDPKEQVQATPMSVLFNMQ
jgi:hypothetical protein